MKLIWIFLFAVISAHAQDNDITHRPKSFSHEGQKAVFVDFEEATYNITYDLNRKKAEVIAKIKMHIVEEGFPLFDLIEEPTSVMIDNIDVTTSVIQTPSKETTLRLINRKLPVGLYELFVKVPLENLVDFSSGVKSAFWVTDLEDRYYLERYIPVNLEYDRVKMVFNLNFLGLVSKQYVFANGLVKWSTKETASIEFPDYFTVNSLYFHTTPVESVELLQSSFNSIDGRIIPVAIYQASGETQKLENVKIQTLEIFNELENDYGAFPHTSITIYLASLAHMGLGGMEYAGATVTNTSSLDHELFHSYFARAVAPANGNAGWIDEALASWRDAGYNRLATLTGSSRMAAHPEYTRKTDTAAYRFGARFMAFLDNKFANKGGLKSFMNKLLDTKIFEPIFTEDFIKEMEAFYGESVQAIFDKYVYAKSIGSPEKSIKEDIHRKLSYKELEAIL